MTDLIKALLIGAALVTVVILIPVVIAVLVPILTFAAIVAAIWFLLRVVSDESGQDPPDRPR